MLITFIANVLGYNYILSYELILILIFLYLVRKINKDKIQIRNDEKDTIFNKLKDKSKQNLNGVQLINPIFCYFFVTKIYS